MDGERNQFGSCLHIYHSKHRSGGALLHIDVFSQFYWCQYTRMNSLHDFDLIFIRILFTANQQKKNTRNKLVWFTWNKAEPGFLLACHNFGFNFFLWFSFSLIEIKTLQDFRNQLNQKKNGKATITGKNQNSIILMTWELRMPQHHFVCSLPCFVRNIDH